jgi:transposase
LPDQEDDVIRKRLEVKPSMQGLSREEIAERWGTTTRTIDRYQKDGRLPPPDYYISKRPRWIEHKVEQAERTALTRR